jgi:hypothetical protein
LNQNIKTACDFFNPEIVYELKEHFSALIAGGSGNATLCCKPALLYECDE